MGPTEVSMCRDERNGQLGISYCYCKRMWANCSRINDGPLLLHRSTCEATLILICIKHKITIDLEHSEGQDLPLFIVNLAAKHVPIKYKRPCMKAYIKRLLGMFEPIF